MNKSFKKEKITKIVQENLPEFNSYKKLDISQLLFQWWAAGRQSESLRLSEQGNQAFQDANITFYEFPLHTKEIKMNASKFTLLLKKIDCPFYLGLKSKSSKSAYIRIYDGKIATLITLYGTFHDYLESLNNVK